MAHRLFRFALAALLALAPLVASRAESVLDHVPANALGLAMVHNLAAADAKVQQVEKIFADLLSGPPPAPLALIRAAFGLGDGLNESGDVVLALLPGDEGLAQSKPLLLVPVSDFAKFAASINGDASGEISRVTIAGQDVLVAKQGEFAVLMNVEHRPTMEGLLAAKPDSPPVLTALGSWLSSNEASVVLLPAAVDMLTAMGQTALAAQQANLDQQAADPQLKEMMTNLKAGLEVYDKILGFCGAEVHAAAVGLAIDDATNLRVSDRIIFEQNGKVAAMQDVPKLAGSAVAGFPAEPFIMAGGGPIPKSWVEALSKLTRAIIEQAPQLYGFENFDEAQWQKVEDSWKDAMDVRSYSMVMFAGGKDEALYSNIFGILKVDDTQKYIAAARKSMAAWNELTAQSKSDIKMVSEVTEVEVAGKHGLLVTTDIAGAAGDENVPMMKPMWDAMFGNEGKMRMYWIPADGQTVIMAVAGEEAIKKALQWVADGEQGMAASATIKTTEGLLNPAAPWTMYVSPQGCVLWFERIYKLMLAQFGAPAVTIPPYPDGPPFGFSMNLTGGQFQGEMVVPVQGLKDLAAYIKSCMD